MSEAKRAGFLARLGVARPERWGPVLARLAVTAATLGLLFWWIPIGEVTEAILGLGLGRWLGVVALEQAAPGVPVWTPAPSAVITMST